MQSRATADQQRRQTDLVLLNQVVADEKPPDGDAAIYAHPRGGLNQAMIEALRQEKPARGRRRTSIAHTGLVPEQLRIVQGTGKSRFS